MSANGYFDKIYIDFDRVNAQTAAEIALENITNAPTSGVPQLISLDVITAENWSKCYGQ